MNADPPHQRQPDRLAASLERAADSARRLAQELAMNRQELVQLMAVRTQRPWTTQEFERYLTLSRAEIALQRSYSSARRLFNHTRLELSRDPV